MDFSKLYLLLPLALPLVHLTAAFCNVTNVRWSASIGLSALGLLLALASALIAWAADAAELSAVLISPLPASHVLAVLIALLGLVIVRYSRHYLAGEPRTAWFAMTLHLTLAAVALVTLTDHMLLLVAAWVGISLSLHELLLLYPERPRAVLAAHKKFLFARIAELALLAAAILLYNQHGTWQISAIVAAYPAELGVMEQLAALLLALAALIKCAQLPMHGWLIQVVEAPTPVSALLHAGIINLGGYLLILFAPLIMVSTPAIWLVLIVAGLTTVLAGLIMTTRVTIKVKLAWSTSSQMGLMLVECALGLYQLALLHLLAHACYKAYRFLRAGSEVEHYLLRRLGPASRASAYAWLAALAVATTASTAAFWWLDDSGSISPWLLLAAMLTLVLLAPAVQSKRISQLLPVGVGALLLGGYLAQKWMVSAAVATPAWPSTHWLADLWVISLICLLCVGWFWLHHSTGSPRARRVKSWLFAGLYLDEWATRTTLRLWAPQLPLRLRAKRLGQFTEEVE